MQQKYKKIVFFALAAIFLLQIAVPVFALEVNYPTINAFGNAFRVDGDTGFFTYLTYFFVFIVVTCGIFAIISIVINGLKILVAFGGSESISKAKTDIMGVLFGILLLMVSVVLLRTINTQLLNQSTSSTICGNLSPGMYYVGYDSDGDAFCAQADSLQGNVQDDVVEAGYQYLFYNCSSSATNPGRNVLAWVYNRPNWDLDFTANRSGNADASQQTINMTTIRIPCNTPNPSDPIVLATNIDQNGTVTPANANTIPLADSTYPIYSLVWEYEQPGVYYYVTNNCTGISSYVQRTNGRVKQVKQPFEGQTQIDAGNREIRSMRILNGSTYGEKYGVILTNETDVTDTSIGTGVCSIPSINTSTSGSTCITLTNAYPQIYNPKSAYILNVDIAPANHNLGPVVLFSEHYKKILSPSTIGSLYVYPPNLSVDSNLNPLIRPPICDGSNPEACFDAGENQGRVCPSSPPAGTGEYACPDPPPAGSHQGEIWNTSSTQPVWECADVWSPNTRCMVNGVAVNTSSCRRKARTCLNTINFGRNSYYVVLYAQNNSNGRTCRVYNRIVRSLTTSTDILRSNRDLYGIAVIPMAY